LTDAKLAPRPAKKSFGIRAIVTYKTVKAAVQGGAAVTLIALWPFGLPAQIQEFALALRHHVTHGWALRFAETLVRHTSRRSLKWTIVALALDAILTGIEGWSLAAGYAWGPWLIVLATSSLLPFEIYEFLRKPRILRALLFLINLLIVIYLGRRAWREHRAGKP
jgi:uncharacterized membrane protein (DUF2068 family)